MLLKIVLDLASLDGFNFFQWLNDLFFHVDSPQIASFGLKFFSFHTNMYVSYITCFHHLHSDIMDDVSEKRITAALMPINPYLS